MLASTYRRTVIEQFIVNKSDLFSLLLQFWMPTDEKACAVEDRVLPDAGDLTTGMPRAVLCRAVIAVDPDGAEKRRKEAERQARVMPYPDEGNTATLTGQRLPAIHAAAAMASPRWPGH